MIKWTRTSRLSIKISLSLDLGHSVEVEVRKVDGVPLARLDVQLHVLQDECQAPASTFIIEGSPYRDGGLGFWVRGSGLRVDG